MDDRFIRTRLLLGDDAMARLRSASVTVVGLGAVGSCATESLVRTGVGRLRQVDFDVINASNINRQLYALQSSIGMKKVDLACARARDINPDCTLESVDVYVNEDSVDRVLAKPVDVVVDAIDSLGPKTGLIEAAVRRGIPIVSSMGAAAQVHSASVRAGDLSVSRGCPLARFVRKRLRKRGIREGVRCVYSTEKARTREAREEADRLGLVAERVTSRTTRVPLGSIAHVTGTFGLRIADEVIFFLLHGKWRQADS